MFADEYRSKPFCHETRTPKSHPCQKDTSTSSVTPQEPSSPPAAAGEFDERVSSSSGPFDYVTRKVREFLRSGWRQKL